MSSAWRRPLAAGALALLTAATVSTGSAAAVEPPILPRTFAELDGQARQEAAALTAEQQQRAAADAAAALALEAFQVAQRQAEQATRNAVNQREQLRAAERVTESARQQLARYIASMYRSGVGDRRLSMLTALADSENPQRLFTGLGLADRVGVNQNDAVSVFAAAERAQARAAERARLTDQAATQATSRAEQAKLEADAAVQTAAARVALAAVALAQTQQLAGQAAVREDLLARAEVIARERSGIPAAAIEGAFALRPLGECLGLPTEGYPNGRIPTAALCPLWGTSGQVLRADAASAFDAMSRAYAGQFGAPICVTDSYRDLPGQIAVAAAKPTLAAVPGTSNHGWGVALDLCDGIEGFGTPQHRWMQENSMAFGWFLPAWAQAGGSKPEPWHWEFAG